MMYKLGKHNNINSPTFLLEYLFLNNKYNDSCCYRRTIITKLMPTNKHKCNPCMDFKLSFRSDTSVTPSIFFFFPPTIADLVLKTHNKMENNNLFYIFLLEKF